MRSYFVPRRGRCYYKEKLRTRRRVYKRTYRRRRTVRASRSFTAPRIHRFKTQVKWSFNKHSTTYDFTSRVYKYEPKDEQTNFAPGTTFIPHQKVANTGLDFVNVLCTQSEQYLPILMENNKNHQLILDKGILGYSALDILDFERPKHQIKDCVKMVYCILSENDQYNECFLHSTLPHEPDFRDALRIINGNDDTIFETQTAIAHCISSDAKMSRGFAKTISNHINGLQRILLQMLLLDQSSPSGTMMQIDSYTTLSQRTNPLRNRLLRTFGHPLRI